LADDLADKPKTLKTRRTKIQRDLAIAGANLSAEEIRERVLAKMLDLRSVLGAAPVKARTAVAALLDGARLAVHRDARTEGFESKVR